MYVYHIFSILSLVVGHLDSFQSLVIVNSVPINMDVQVVLLYLDTLCFGYMLRCGSAGLYIRSIFSFLRKLHTAFCSGCTNLHSQKQWISVSFPPTSFPAFFAVCIIDFWLEWSEISMSFQFTFPLQRRLLSISSCSYWACVFLLWELSVQFICPSIQCIIDSFWARILFYLFTYLFLVFILFICAYDVWVISPPSPHHLPYPSPPPTSAPHPLATWKKLFLPYL
jgi:hypothetical protein